jgi:Concanavalin A-like lectin/glucanases superfamily
MPITGPIDGLVDYKIEGCPDQSPVQGSPVSIATNSIVFASVSSQYLSATGKVGINQQKFTFATWFKTSTTAAALALFDFSDGTTSNRVFGQMTATGLLQIQGVTASASVLNLVSTSAFNDGNWHHVLFGVDTTQATANNRGVIYIDGTLATLGTNTQPSQNANLSNNFAATYDIGSQNGTSRFFNGNLAQLYYIDGQQLPPSNFITGTPGVPKTYSGSYTGTFDFFLNFANSGSLGADSSGEGNNWTPVNSPTQSTDHP